jgi:hypothetical protein
VRHAAAYKDITALYAAVGSVSTLPGLGDYFPKPDAGPAVFQCGVDSIHGLWGPYQQDY